MTFINKGRVIAILRTYFLALFTSLFQQILTDVYSFDLLDDWLVGVLYYSDMAFLIHQRLTSLKSLHEFGFVIFCFLPQHIRYSIIAIVISFNYIWFLSLWRFHLYKIKIWIFNWSSNNLVILILRKFFDVDFLYFLYYILFPTFPMLDRRI